MQEFNKKPEEFYYYARGSVSETQSFLLLSKDLKFIDNDELLGDLFEQAKEVKRMINGLVRSIENTKKINH